ncbi:pimeloyl-ACP methyl ester carboxylesterase [Streptomyces sp. TLI_235]|nr:alpha/beta hydrolase [Streptomyces sp. TLI_235]PBC70760.1 pimeloyl-ACP methyl ester carboxylesterase [Streptomyces sp. TLI_235]
MAGPGPVTRTVRLPGGPLLPYAEQGDPAGPPVVLLHAVADSWRAFEPLMARLPGTLHVLAPSQRGHGGASCPPQGYRPADFAADLAGFLDLLGIERAVLVGASSAGFTVRRFAADHPRRVTGLVFLGSPALLCDKPAAAALRESVARFTDPLDPVAVRALVESLPTRPLPPEFVDLMVQESLRAPARVWRDTLQGLLDETDLGGLDGVTAPALLIWGDRDGILPRADQERLAAALPRSTLLVHEGSGHVVHWDDPARTATDLAAFVAACAGPA